MRALHVFSLPVFSLLVACGGGAAAVEVGGAGHGTSHDGRPPDPLALLPDDTMAVLRVDVAQLRRSPYSDTVIGMLSQAVDAAAEAEQSSMGWDRLAGIVDRTDQAFLAATTGRASSDDLEVLLLLRGTYQPRELEELAAETVEETGAHLAIQDHDGQRILISEDVAGVQLGDHTWILASRPELVHAALARASEPPAASPLAAGRMRAMAERVSFHSTAVAAVAEPRGELARQLQREIPSELNGGYEAVGARLDASDGIDAMAVIVTGDARLAEVTAQLVRDEIQQAAGQTMLTMMGLGPLFSGTTVRVEGKTVVITLTVSDADTRTILNRVGGFLTLMLQAAAANTLESGSPPPPTP